MWRSIGNLSFWPDLLFLARCRMLRGMQNVHRYFPAGTPQKAWGLYVTCAGRSRTEPGAEFPSRAHPDEYYFTWARGRVLDEWQLVLLKEGRGEAELRGRRFALEQGTLLALPPGRWHRYRPDPATGWTTLWVGFGGDMADRIAGIAGLGPDGGVRNLSSRMAVRERFSATVSELLADGGARAFWAAARLHVLVAAIAEEAPDGTGGARARRARAPALGGWWRRWGHRRRAKQSKGGGGFVGALFVFTIA